MNKHHAVAEIKVPEHYPGGSSDGDDHSLVAEAKSGHARAFGILYERHHAKIYRTAFQILRNRHDSEDAVQRAFQRAFTHLDRFREDSAFPTWMTRIAINEALMMLRQRRPQIRSFDGESSQNTETSFSDIADKGPAPDEICAENEVRAILMQAVLNLRKTLREVVLGQMQGLTLPETAQRLGLTLAAAKARTFHAKRHLRQHFERHFKVRHKNPFLIGTQV